MFSLFVFNRLQEKGSAAFNSFIALGITYYDVRLFDIKF